MRSPCGCDLEHQVLDEVREPGFAVGIVARADVVAQRDFELQRARIGHHDEPQAIRVDLAALLVVRDREARRLIHAHAHTSASPTTAETRR